MFLRAALQEASHAKRPGELSWKVLGRALLCPSSKPKVGIPGPKGGRNFLRAKAGRDFTESNAGDSLPRSRTWGVPLGPRQERASSDPRLPELPVCQDERSYLRSKPGESPPRSRAEEASTGPMLTQASLHPKSLFPKAK